MTEAERRKATMDRALGMLDALDSIWTFVNKLYDAGLLREPVEWRPIESAPKDGTSFLATNGLVVCEAVWHKSADFNDVCHTATFDEDSGDFSTCYWPSATHWQPLPPPPQEDSSNG